MGLLSEGTPLSWEETKKLADHVRRHGIIQFINQYNKLKERSKDCLLWGDEVEYILVNLNKKKRKATLLLNAEHILNHLMAEEKNNPEEHQTTWRPEYASYMVEGTPGRPYGHRMAHFNMVEANMKRRREEVMKLLSDNDENYALTLTNFPRLGCVDFTTPPTFPNPSLSVSRSLFWPDPVTFQGHPRFRTLTRNIRERRGEKPAINVPIFRDKNTPNPFIEKLTPGQEGDSEGARAALPDSIYMDSMGFGMGCCCLQVTFQACNIDEARLLYDQLTPLCPIMLALSAASPIYRGYLSDVDCRWSVISGSVDDRTKEERGLEPLKYDRFVIGKSRYDSIDSYLSPCSQKYNDLEIVYDKAIFQTLVDAGIDNLLSLHVAHLFIRDPISLFSEKIDQNDDEDTDHFENIQSTNWQTMRFKPPPPNTDIGWRVEFRPMEVQLTDFENAAFVVFIVLLTRVILSYRLNFVIPISKVDENMKTGQKRNAAREQKFYFKKDIMTCNTPKEAENVCSCGRVLNATKTEEVKTEDEYDLFTIEEIICGKKDVFPGLKVLIENYLKSVDDIDVDTSCTISQYLNLISRRASGKLMTTASWMRSFVTSHPDYKQDSVVSDPIAFDLVETCAKLTAGVLQIPKLLSKHETRSNEQLPAAMQQTDEQQRAAAASSAAK